MTKTQTDSIKVKSNKYDISKDKLNDYLESIHNTLTKPVGKTHTSNFIFMGKKKQKKQKKTKKIKVKKAKTI